MRRQRNRRGSTIVEFAILAVPLVVLAFAFFELLLMSATSMMLTSATEEVARIVYTGQFQKRSDNTGNDLKALFCDQAVILVNCNNLLIDLRDFGGWDNVELPELINADGTYTVDSESSGTEEVAICGERIVVMRVLYRWELYTPGIAYFLRGTWAGNKFLFQARVFIVEPWDFTVSC